MIEANKDNSTRQIFNIWNTGWPKKEAENFCPLFAKYWPIFIFFTGTFCGTFAMWWEIYHHTL